MGLENINSNMTTAEFVNKARKVHGDKYDYSLVDYQKSNIKVQIICPVHGVFEQNPYSHTNGNGCPECAGLKKRTTETFIKKAKEVHGDRYDYSKTVYVNKRTRLTITCPIHGDFEQIANGHIRGAGCPSCGKKYAVEYNKYNYTHFCEESKKRFGDIYEFPDIEKLYINSHSKILIKCKKCGNVYEKIACDHITSSNGGCLHCYSHKSYAEEEIGQYVQNLVGADDIEFNNRSILNGLELDIYIPSKKIAIEYNGVYWHSDISGKDKNYHLMKSEMCENKGIRLIQIFEDEYYDRKEIVLEKIKHILGCSDNKKIMARKCEIKEIKKELSDLFLEKFHIQGSTSASVRIGAYYNDNLIAVMTFKKENNNSNNFELNRFASDYKYICQGIGSRLMKFFVINYKPTEIKSFADRRWTSKTNNIYEKIGFKIDKILLPDYRYVFNKSYIRHHKFGFRKHILSKKYGFPLSMTENEMTKKLNCHKIWDCGLIKYVWKNEKV